jgi:hypothetical protein
VQHVEQLNAYVVQMPCWYNSPSYNPGMTPANVPFPEADLVSHVLQMCLQAWQDQYNLHKKGMTPVDMRLLLTSFEAIICVCTQERANKPSSKKASVKIKVNQAIQYWIYEAGYQEIPFQEALQLLQETWGCTYYTCYEGML